MTSTGENIGAGQRDMSQYGVPYGQQQPQQQWFPPAAPPGSGMQWEHSSLPPQTQLQQRPHSQSGTPQLHGEQKYDAAQFALYGHDAFDPVLVSQAAQPLQHPAYAWPNDFNSTGYAGGNLDPSLNGGAVHGQGMSFVQTDQFAPTSVYQQTIAPATLQMKSVSQPAATQVPVQTYGRTITSVKVPTKRSVPPTPSSDPTMSLDFTIPRGVADGSFSVISQSAMDAVTMSKPLSMFLNLGKEAQEFAKVTKSSALPNPPRRKSRNEIKGIAANDPRLTAKLARGKVTKTKLKAIRTKAVKPSRPKLLATRLNSTSTASTPDSAGESSEDDSEDDSSGDELEIIEEPPFGDKRPDSTLDAAAYDATMAVWLPRRKPPTPAQLKKALVDFWEVLSTVRNRWKSDGEALKKAEEAKKQKEIPMLKDRVKIQRDILEASITAALKYGHPEVLRLMGGNKPYLQMTYLFLADRLRDNDASGNLSRLLLKLLARATSAPTELLEQYKLTKALGMVKKKGDDEIKALVKDIEEAGVVASKAQAEKSKEGAPAGASEQVTQPTTTTTAVAQPAAGALPVAAKRALPPDGAATQPVKRVASASATAKKPTVSLSKTPQTAAAEKTPSPATAAKPRATNLVKSASLYAGLKSASKKPSGTTAADRKTGQTPTATDKKPAAPAAAPPVPSATSSWKFSTFMEDVTKKEVEPPKPKEKAVTRGPETEAEKRKRLRRESLRDVRVQFKADGALTQVRVFERDPDEESGHDASMVRDVGDSKSEGQMFKQHHNLAEMDVDEEYEPPAPVRTEEVLEYTEPRQVDFDDLDAEVRKTNFARFGGPNQPVSRETEVQNQHESSTLLAVYLSKSDIPPNPREPSDPYTGDQSGEQKEFGEVPAQVIERAKRLAPKPASAAAAGLTPDIADLLASLAKHAPTAQQPAQQPAAPAASVPVPQQPQTSSAPPGLEALFATFDKFKEPNSVLPPPAAPAPAPATTAPDLNALLASLQGIAPAAPQAVPQIPPPPFPGFPGALGGAANPPNLDFNALMAQLAQAGAQPAPGGAPPYPGYAPAMQQQGSNGGVDGSAYEQPDRKRRLDNMSGGNNDYDMANGEADSKKQRGNYNGGNYNNNRNNNNNRDGWQPPKFVLPCHFWKEGRCRKGASCTYLHE